MYEYNSRLTLPSDKSRGFTARTINRNLTGLGFTRVEGRPICDEVTNGQQFCFRNTTTVDGHPPEERFAINQGCLPLRSGAQCETSPYGNPGNKFCCPSGWPREPGSGPLQPGEFPPSPPGVGNKITFWSQYWWFWALVAGVPVAGYLGYRYLQDAGYIKDTPYLMDTYGIEDVEVGAY